MAWGSKLATIGISLICALEALAAPLSSPLIAHEAVYDMTLKSAKPASGVLGAKGTMNYKFVDSCDGWVVEHRTTFSLSYNEGGEVETSWTMLSWEAKDGSNYRFRISNSRDGEAYEEIQGEAKIDRKTGIGQATFFKPENITITLPKGTVFPSQHSLALIIAANKGLRNASHIVFDGIETKPPNEISSLIAVKKSDVETPFPMLQGLPSWMMQMAFFASDAAESTPEMEMSARYFDNGVVSDLIQSYGNFTIGAKLIKLENLPKPDC